ncbi:hypothetical protein WJX74_000654 [Apatococcus lobatus]|uniref:BACON domain-containing protein n=1 Tax=Apatococcus lobatus TaxID=904363 RepID=A0AAW1QAF6_9CHLO
MLLRVSVKVAACTNSHHEILISWHEGGTLVGQIALTQDGCLQIADMNLRWIPEIDKAAQMEQGALRFQALLKDGLMPFGLEQGVGTAAITGVAPAPGPLYYTDPFSSGLGLASPAPQNPTLSQQLGGTPIVNNAGVESEGGTGTPVVDPFYGQSTAVGSYGSPGSGTYGGSSSSPSPAEPPASAPGPSVYPAMAPGPFVGSAPAPGYTNPFAAGVSQTPPAPQNPTLSQQLGGTPVVSNAGVESEGGTGTPTVDPFYNQPAAIGGYGASAPGQYGGAYSAPSPSPAGLPATAPGPFITPAMAPAPLAPDALASGAAVESAPGSETLICYFSGVSCFSATMGDSVTQSSSVQLECTSGSSSRVAYTIDISYPVGTGNWLSISPSSGSLLTNAGTPTQLTFQVAPSGVGLGEHVATVAVVQSGTTLGQTNVTLVVLNDPTLTFISFAPDNLGNTLVSAQVAVDYVPALTNPVLNATLIGAGSSAEAIISAAPAPVSQSTIYNVQGLVGLQDSLNCLATNIYLQTTLSVYTETTNLLCGSRSAASAVQLCSRPTCSFYPIDMAYTGSGLTTIGTEALVLMACSNPVSICPTCLSLTGPTGGNVTILDYDGTTVPSANFYLSLSWNGPYTGPVQLDIESNRLTPACSLGLAHSACGGYTSIGPVAPLNFTVGMRVPFRGSAFEVSRTCSGSSGICSFNS